MGWLRALGVMALLFCAAGAFNIDLPSKLVHRSDQPESMFGFSVAMHRDRGESRLLVGAPRYNTEQQHFGVRNAGAVLKCSAVVANACDYVPFDRKGNNIHPLGGLMDEKSNQWFGATLKSSGEDGVVVACAPRYTWFTSTLRKREPVGTCYVARNGLTDFQEYSPCRTNQWGYHRQGSCQAGFDAALSKEGDRLYIGAPGAYYWQGQIHSQHLQVRTLFNHTREGPAIDDDQYLGYSVGSGDFTGDGIADVALGVPKGLNYTGKVAIYTHDLINLQNITGYQLGSYFGYCLTVTDFNGDGRDDLIVGAPMYTDYTDKEMKYEVGRVHVLLQNSLHRFKQVITFQGTETRGRFGLSVAALGDINMDGYNDIAVGAPYGGPDGSGAVYIYHGFQLRSGEPRDPEKEKPVQIITSRDVSSSIDTFGWSLSGGLDMDGNLYPDLLVGAYLSNSVVMLKTRPVVNMVNYTLQFMSESRTVNIEQKDCQTRTGASVPCIDLQLCLAYSGVAVGEQSNFNVKYELDTKVSEPRLYFIENDKRLLRETIRLAKDTVTCKTRQVYVKTNLKDKLSPLNAEVQLELVSPPLKRRRRDAPPLPILNMKQNLVTQDAVTIRKNCGPDNICVPDLILTVLAPSTYTIGNQQQLSINVRVANDAEDAFEAAVYIPVPAGLLYNKFVALENTSATCSPRKRDGRSVVICDVGNPLPKHKGVLFDLFFQQAGNLDRPQFEFIVIANSTNSEADHTLEDNVASAIVDVTVDTELYLYGNSDPETLEYNITEYPDAPQLGMDEEDFGPEVVHEYVLSNRGPSDVLQAEIVILWPLKTTSGNHLLYLLEPPFTGGPVVCTPAKNVTKLNPLELKLFDRSQTYKRFNLQTSTSFKSSSSHFKSSSSSSSGSITSTQSASGSATGRGYSGGASYGGGSASSSTHYSSGGGSYRSGGGYSRNYTSYSSSSSGYKSGSSSAQQNSIRRRIERAASGPELDWDVETTRCGDTDCVSIRCFAGPLAEDNSVKIFLRSRVLLQTLQQESMFAYKDVQISSRMIARVKSLPHGVNPDLLKVRSVTASTPMSPVVSLDSPPPVPWWIILLATLGGILILLIIILILWSCGYFKRNRPNAGQQEDEASRPLQANGRSNGHSASANGRNGHPHSKPLYPGDEAL